jgi:hypothetical protein
MTTSHRAASPDAVDAAIARVLEAERAARDAVVQAGETAAAMTEEARAAARTLAERTERRIRGIRAAFEERATAEVAALDATAAATSQERALGADELARVEAAVAALAASLTGSGS